MAAPPPYNPGYPQYNNYPQQPQPNYGPQPGYGYGGAQPYTQQPYPTGYPQQPQPQVVYVNPNKLHQ
jgi:hypothetical protein